MDENFEMDRARVELFFADKLTADDLTLDEIEWLDDAVRVAVMNKIKERGLMQ
jgi:hypothetical protein